MDTHQELQLLEEEIEVRMHLEQGVQLPTYATNGASGADIRAHLKEAVVLESRQSAVIPTGVRLEIPKGYEIQIRPRSGLAARHGVTVLNTPGTIDSDYRGELGVILINHSDHSFVVEPNMRIAQLVLAPVAAARFMLYDALSSTKRGSGGFGHTGAG